MTTDDCRYGSDNLRCNAQHGPSAITLETDAPTDNQGKGERFSPPLWWIPSLQAAS